jgi:hypothetical protein
MSVKMSRCIWFLMNLRTPKWDLLCALAVFPLEVGSFGVGKLSCWGLARDGGRTLGGSNLEHATPLLIGQQLVSASFIGSVYLLIVH